MLPMMQNTVIVLLKLLLATVTGTGAQGSQLSTGGMAPPLNSPTQDMPPQQEALPPPTKEEIDIARHREITSKAVSAIILLLLKWFKASHILKFHHLTQLLLDSNCLVLVLKIFGLQELSQMVQTKNEMPDCSFFQYLHLNASKAAKDKTAEPDPPAENSVKVTEEDGEEVEVITDYSWRNFFAAINLVKILQKITKHRVHRILLMCQYKSSAILKRVLRVNHPMLQLQVLKLVKSQMPYFGRKWRSSELAEKVYELTPANMKIITSIYLNCRPELRNDWLVGVEADLEAEDQIVGIPQEHALRSLIAFYNKMNYAAHMAPSMPDEQYRRMDSGGGFLDHAPLSPNRRRSRLDSLSATSEDIFDATRDPSMPYNPDGMIEFWMHEYEDVLRDVFGDGTRDEWADPGSPASPAAPGPAEGRNDAAWIRLGELMRARGAPEDDTISDSESVVSVGELGDDARLEAEAEGRTMFAAMQDRKRRTSQGDENTWEVSPPRTGAKADSSI